MNAEFVKKSLRFHGQPLQKIWDDERGAGDLSKIGVPIQPNYDVYQERQKYFTFQDRAKRFKLHQFLARKATDLFDSDLINYSTAVEEKFVDNMRSYFTTMSPYETFSSKSTENNPECWLGLAESIKPGDIIYGKMSKKLLRKYAWSVKPLCTAEPLIRSLNHLDIKALIAPQDVGPLPLDEQGNIRNYSVNDYVRCEVYKVADMTLIIGMRCAFPKNVNGKLGLIDEKDLPLYYRMAVKNPNQNFEESLQQSKEFLNPNYDVLYSVNGINVNDSFTMMSYLKQSFPQKDYAKELRAVQANKWAFRSVAEGIERFKNGEHMEAFQCLNKALSIDPHNVEGLVARGALYAYRAAFQKAVDDFETALKINPYHANARKYMGETLVALGRSLEENENFERAAKAYKDCLKVIPDHIQANESLANLNLRMTGNMSFKNGMLNQHHTSVESAPTNSSVLVLNETTPQNKTSRSCSSRDDKTSDSESSVSDSDTQNNQNKREGSLSPLSKRMAIHAAAIQSSGSSHIINKSSYEYPFHSNIFKNESNTQTDFKLDDDDTESRVHKLLQDASQHKKEKKHKRKSKSKKDKKSKKDHEKKTKDDYAYPDPENTSFQNTYLRKTLHNVGSRNMANKLKHDISSYDHKIADIDNRQALLRDSLTETLTNCKSLDIITIEDSPPPQLPSMRFVDFSTENTYDSITHPYVNTSSTSSKKTTFESTGKDDTKKLSFQIRKQVVVDKFELFHTTSPAYHRSRSHSKSPKSLSHRRHGSKLRLRSRSKSCSRSRSDRRDSRYHSRSCSRSRSYHRSSRSRSRLRSSSRSSSYYQRNRDQKSSSYKRCISSSIKDESKNRYKYYSESHPLNLGRDMENENKRQQDRAPKADDGPTIEEIDEIINKAQKERKEEIIKRDKDLLKKPYRNYY